METMTDAMEKISDWIEQKYHVQKEIGLSRQQIKAKIRNIPFEFSTEAYDFFQHPYAPINWHKGKYWENIFDIYDFTHFMDLEESIGFYVGKYYHLNLFPICMNEYKVYFIEMEEKEKLISRVVSVEHHMYVEYPSLTNMMLCLGERLEKFGVAWYEQNYQEMQIICRKYGNSGEGYI